MILSSAPILDVGYHEKRKHQRRMVSWTVKGQFIKNKSFEARTINISESGMLLHMSKQIPQNTRAYIKVDAFIAGRKHTIDGIIEFKHCVISNNQFQCGVQFLKISNSNKVLLKAFATNTVSGLMYVGQKNEPDVDDILGLASLGRSRVLTEEELDSSIEPIDINPDS